MKVLKHFLPIFGMALLVSACETIPLRPAGPAGAPRTASRSVAKAPAPMPSEPSGFAATIDAAALDGENNVYFQPGLSMLDERALEVLDRHAERLKQNPRLVVTLSGHTDDLGSPAYNLAVAERRVETVAKYLLARGVSKLQLRRIALGHEKAGLMRCHSDPCREAMRRVQLAYE